MRLKLAHELRRGAELLEIFAEEDAVLGVGFMVLGFLWLDQYLSSGGVYLARERTWLNGRGALTAPVSALGGGLALLCFGIYSRFRLRTLRRNSSRAAV